MYLPKDYHIDGQNTLKKYHKGREKGTPDYTLGVDFWTKIFYNLKNSGYDLSNEGSNFILSLLEVGH